MSKHRNIKGIMKSASKYRFQLAAVAVAICLLVVSCFFGSGKSEKTENIAAFSAGEYTRTLEKKLENLLSSLDGAGEVKVMITLENGSESKFATQISGKTENGGNSREEMSEEYVVIKKGASNEECVVISVSEPRVRGVAVAAQGAGSASVKKAITETVCAVFDVTAADVSVEIMKYEKE